jgi:hypothetical protein
VGIERRSKNLLSKGLEKPVLGFFDVGKAIQKTVKAVAALGATPSRKGESGGSAPTKV